MGGRCISYWNSPFLWDMLVFRGVRLEHFTNIRTTYMLECSPQEVLFFKSQTKAAGIQQIFQLLAGWERLVTWEREFPMLPTCYLGLPTQHGKGRLLFFHHPKCYPRKRPQRWKKMRLADFSNVLFRLVGSSWAMKEWAPWLFRIDFWILLIHIINGNMVMVIGVIERIY